MEQLAPISKKETNPLSKVSSGYLAELKALLEPVLKNNQVQNDYRIKNKEFLGLIKKYRLLLRRFLLSLSQNTQAYQMTFSSNQNLSIQIEILGSRYFFGWIKEKTETTALHNKKLKPTLIKRQQQLALLIQKMTLMLKKMNDLIQKSIVPGLNKDLLVDFLQKITASLKNLSENFGELLKRNVDSGKAGADPQFDPIEMTLLALLASELKTFKPQIKNLLDLIKRYQQAGVSSSNPLDQQTIQKLLQALKSPE